MKQLIKKDTTNKTVLIFIQDSSATTGTGLANVTASMITAYYMRVEDDNDVTLTAITLVDAVGTGTTHYDGGLEEVSDNVKGWYRLDLPDACFATGADAVGVNLQDGGANNIAQITMEFQLVDFDPHDGVRLGLTALPNAAADAGGGLPISDAGGLDLDAMNVNVNDIETDTNELQGDWTNGGRLDLIIDAVLVDTAEIGTAGAGLSNITWNASWDAEVQSEVTDSLVAHNLDHLCLTATGGADMTSELADNTILSRILSNGDTSVFVPSTDGLQPIRDELVVVDGVVDTVLVDTNELQTDWTDGGRLDLIVDAVLVDTAEIGTAGAGLSDLGGMSTGMKGEVNTEVDGSMVTYGLDHLLSTSVTGTDVTDNSIVASLVSKESTADWDDFVNTTDSLQATRDKLTDIETDTAEIGSAGAGLSNITWNASWDAEVQSEVADALNVAIPGSPVADSINQRLVAVDALTEASGNGDLAAILTDTAEIGSAGAGLTSIFTTALTEAYATDGSAFTPAQSLYMIWSAVSEFAISSTTITSKKLDGSTTAMTHTLDDETSPTSRTRAT